MADITGDELRSSAREQMQNAFDHFKELVDRVPADVWGNATPCQDWDVRALLNHMTAEHLWAPRLLAGESIEQVGGDYDGDVLGDDPIAAWDTAQMKSRESWAAATDDTPVELSSGRTSAEEYAEQMLLDLTVHAWDLARGAGIAEGPVVADTVMHVLHYVRESGLVGHAPFGPEVSTDSDNPQVQLVALLGRRP